MTRNATGSNVLAILGRCKLGKLQPGCCRSPSLPRCTNSAVDDLRPPVKRAKDDAFDASGYCSSAPGAADVGRNYPPPPRLRTPPPGPPGAYYDGARDYPPWGVSPAPSARDRDREYMDGRGGYAPLRQARACITGQNASAEITGTVYQRRLRKG
ncbi:uncharacterized protein PHACADRAFT_185689 [Phanerochaete carnosa HHB-10118-sp]|uniref:Uncharacterized protein n=1 Tax=Phanerochaete carnosa (strain HHB-10118-sp) TaxID=650164 RepID=K5UXP1_PHACS|nr:uncharacterized protein PHACADRAFT_185689 [Phanerochaete carnosa HHB-10118-sp]EKM54846.1 hypothetical protein PHACADRAFT_185689 [Phanerochaete carnosa HHB-10118-sp]